ncbi:MAG: hypothetical protein GXP26_04810 [Planctomycetes bacterium]|nr:hypothetical protein [Planctomycetota bacterium]
MEKASIVPRVAFVLNLGVTETTDTIAARIQHLIHLFQGHRLPATWVVADTKCAKLLASQRTASSMISEFALTVDGPWSDVSTPPTAFRRELADRCAAIRAKTGRSIKLVVGDPQSLRVRAALLAEQGIGGIFSTQQDRTSTRSRPLPCGLWQLELNVRIPLVRSFSQWFTSRRVSAKQLISAGSLGETTLVAVDTGKLGTSNARSLQAFEKMLCEVSWAASRNQLVVTTAGAIVAELTSQQAVKPQRSILRVAA